MRNGEDVVTSRRRDCAGSRLPWRGVEKPQETSTPQGCDGYKRMSTGSESSRTPEVGWWRLPKDGDPDIWVGGNDGRILPCRPLVSLCPPRDLVSKGWTVLEDGSEVWVVHVGSDEFKGGGGKVSGPVRGRRDGSES